MSEKDTKSHLWEFFNILSIRQSVLMLKNGHVGFVVFIKAVDGTYCNASSIVNTATF